MDATVSNWQLLDNDPEKRRLEQILNQSVVERKRDLRVLDKGVFTFNVGLQKANGIGQRGLPYEVMGITEKEAKKLQVRPPSITISKSVATQENKLRAVIAKIQGEMFSYPPYKFFHHKQLEVITSLCDELQEKHKNAIEYITEAYEADLISFEVRLNQTLDAYDQMYKHLKDTSDRQGFYYDRETVVKTALRKVPKLEKIVDEFRIVWHRVEYIPSILEQAENDANLARAYVAKDQADKLLELNRLYAEQTQNLLGKAVDSAKEEIASQLIGVIQKIKELQPDASKRPQALKKEIEAIIERSSILLEIDKNLDLEGLTQQASAIAQTIEYREHNEFKQMLFELECMCSSVADILTEEQGHRSRAQFISFED